MDTPANIPLPKVALIKIGIMNRAESRAVPPLGCMYLAAVLREKLAAGCRILDARLDLLSDQQIGDWVAEDVPLLIGLSVMTTDSMHMHRLAAHLKGRFPQVPVVVGGPHASSDMDDILSDPNIDRLVYGEGEATLLELVEALWRRSDTDGILGTAYRRNGENRVNPPRPFVEDLDAMPFPAWDLIDYRAYFRRKRIAIFYKNSAHMPVFTSRACPYRCVYCHSVFGKRFRSRSPDDVMTELRTLYRDFGIREFEFYDDCFNADRSRCKEILRRFAESEMQDATLQFPNGLRADIIDDETIALLKQARVFAISIAVESASPRIQKIIKKNVNLDKLKAVTEKISRQGIIQHGFFMFGFPGETKEEMEETLRFALDLDIATASFFIVNPFKETELARMAEEAGTRLETEPENYDYFRTSINLSQLSDAELSGILRKAYFRFYLSWKRLVRLLRAVTRCPSILFMIPKMLLDRILFIKIGK